MKSAIPLMLPTLFIGIKNNSIKLLSSFLILFTLLFSGTAFAQDDFVRVGQSKLTCVFNDTKSGPCKSNDLTVLDLIAGDPEKPCDIKCEDGTITLPLTMRINNTTGSVRTAFALYGTLSKDASIAVGNQTVSGKIFVCVGPIDITQGINSFPIGTITFPCDATTLTLSDNYLAYTPANSTTAALCATLADATSCQDIGPKCGVSKTINILIPVTASAATAKEPCLGATTGGSIRVTANNGKAGYTANIYKKPLGDCSATEPGTSDANFVTSLTIATAGGSETTTETLAPGAYCIYVTDGNGCTILVPHTIAGVSCCENPAKPIVTSTSANICQPTVDITICNATNGATYYLKSPANSVNPTSSQVASGSTVTFTGLAPGAGFSVYGIDEVNSGCTAGPTAGCDDIVTVCPQVASGASNQSQPAVQEITLQKLSSRPKVTAAPNPFNDRIRFSLKSEVTGRGTLELYNMLGQKVKTVFQGQVNAGQVQTIEYAVPVSQRSNLIYVFRVGAEQTSGKLVGLKQ
jgi:hypothetical protein